MTFVQSFHMMTKVQTRELTDLINALRQYRLEQDFTYRELAKRIGIGHSRLFGLLNNKQPRINDRTRYRVETFASRVGLREKVAS